MTLRSLLFFLLWTPLAATASTRTESRTILVEGRARTYRLHVPDGLPRDRPAPLVLAFHGGGGQGFGTERLTGFSALADREKFLVVYPDGLDRRWNDGRNPPGLPASRERVDDIAFVRALLDALAKEFPVDPRRVFATGISNGAMFSHFLATRLAGRIAAIAPVVGGVPEEVAQDFRPGQPVSVLIIQGTMDPLVPYAGGPVTRWNRGRVISTDEAVRRWVKHDGCAGAAITGDLPDRDPNDGCRVRWTTWTGGRAGTEVTLYTITGGGHTWPGGAQYLPRSFIGNVCRDFDAAEVIWEFFQRHPKA
jgi:polyhydroxybutyrate depolymerase